METYLLITPAHNEEAFIERTIESMVAQNLRPILWIIVNDGSTDRTSRIVSHYAARYRFIKLIDLERNQARGFAKKAAAFNRGLAEAQRYKCQYVGNLDADIVLAPCYFEGILSEFKNDPHLGIAGGIVFTNIHGTFRTTDENIDSVGGAVQLFRKECLDAVGGYLPLRYGGIDAAAEITAKMLGWKVRKFPSHKVYEQRRTGSAQGRPLHAKVCEGRRCHSLGYHPLFYLARCVYRINDPPFLAGSIAALYGFLESVVVRRPTLLPSNVVAYLRAEQTKRLKRLTTYLAQDKPATGG